MYLDQTVKLQVRVKRDDWLDVVISMPIDNEDIVTFVLEALDEYFKYRVDSVTKDLNILKLCNFTKGY